MSLVAFYTSDTHPHTSVIALMSRLLLPRTPTACVCVRVCGSVYLCVLCQWQPFLCLLTYSAVDIPLHWRAIASDIGLRTKDTGHRTSGALYIGHWPSEKWNEKLPAIICSINRRFPPALHKGFSFNPSLDKALILFHFQTRTKSIGWLLLEVFTWVIILLYFFKWAI